MTEQPSIDFTVTPYYEGVEPAAGPGRPALGLAYLPAALWLGAGVIAVAANFLEVNRFHSTGQGPDTTDFSITVSYSGWGKPSFKASQADGFSDSLNSGARWGWLFTACAVLLLAAAIWSITPRVRVRLFGPADLAGVGGIGLFASVAALVLSFQPTRHQLEASDLSSTTFHWGWCWPVELVAGVLALLGWGWFRWQRDEPVLTEPAMTGFEPQFDPEFTYPQTENWSDDATDRPHIPRDPGPAPW